MTLPDYTLAGPPRISPAVFAEVLDRAQSPAAPENAGGALYAIPAGYGLDPAIALAFFQHESRYGTEGLARTTRAWGNQRRSPTGRGVVRDIPGRGPFAHFQTWADGLRDWCAILNGPVYAGHGLRTVGQIVPVYAPSSDGNRPAVYARAVCTAVAAWEQLSRAAGWRPPGEVDPWAAWGDLQPPTPAGRQFAIPRRWLAEGNLGAAVSPELYPNGGGRSVQFFERGVIVWLGGERTEVLR